MFRRKIEAAAESQSDEQALQSIELFPHWKAGIAVLLGKRFQHNGVLYEVIQPHTTQAGWEPNLTPALWKVVSLDEWPEIPENISAENPWMNGQKGTWQGHHYTCLMDNCVWNPSQYPAAWRLES